MSTAHVDYHVLKPTREGILAGRGAIVYGAIEAVLKGSMNRKYACKMVLSIVKSGDWQEYTFAGEHVRPRDFMDFVKSDPPRGFGIEYPVLMKLIEGSEAYYAVEELIRGKPGGANNPYGRDGKPEEIKCDIITLDYSPVAVIAKPPTGTSSSYAISRLKHQAPELLDEVKAGKITPHAAMVQAGFRERQITIPADPAKAAKRLRKNFVGERWAELLRELHALDDPGGSE